jgi:3-hydroxyacyl-CoA dehydrogenase / enoyl-CoA hydratase / 3-hydroxybutyryl-CoA epimerase
MASQDAAATANPPVRFAVDDGIGIIRIDDPGRAVNVLSREVVSEMAALVERVEGGGASGVRAVVILSEKPGTWVAGADVDDFMTFRSPADGARLSQEGNELLLRLERLPVPVVAAIDGAALGGGLELALACTYRIATDSEKTRLALPEVQLGVIPGAGGTQRLPRLVGLRAALDLMLTGKRLDAKRARRMGLVDEVVPAAVLEEVAVRAARELADGSRKPRAGSPRGSPEWVERLPGMKQLIFKKAREGVLEKTHGHYPAPLRIIEVVREGIDRPLEEAVMLEPPVFGELAVSPEARGLVHLFFATTEAKGDAGVEGDAEPAEVTRVGVIGAGFMGQGIATVSAEREMRVRLKDVDVESAGRALTRVRQGLSKRAGRRRRPEHEVEHLLARVEATHEYTGFGNAELVVEAVFEDVDLKHGVIRELEPVLADDAVLGSNTSTIPISRLAEAVQRPERMIGLHFFSPVEKMPLLEIIVAPETSERTVATAHAWAKRLGKTPIVVNDGPGFYTSRILAPYMNEAALLLEEGGRIEEIDRAMLDWGFPVGPMALYDEVGLDVAAKVSKVLSEAFGERLKQTGVVKALTGDGRMGRKNERGLFRYEGGKKTGPDESVYALIGDPPAKRIPPPEIQDRLSLMMVNEAVRCLEEGVLRTPRDGDVGAVMGLGFPPFRGGPFWYVDRTGAREIVERLRGLEERHGPRFAPATRLVEMARAGQLFFPDDEPGGMA